MSTTLTNLRDVCYNLLREDEQDSSAYPYTLVDLLINSAQQRICSGMVSNPLTKETVVKGQLPFVNSTAYYSNQAPTTLVSEVAIGATTIELTSVTNYPTSGKGYIAGNIITYTGITSTTLTGVTGVLFAFTAGSEFSLIFDLPTDYSNPINLTYNNKYKLEQKLYEDMWEDLNNYKGTYSGRNTSVGAYNSPYRARPFYTIIDGKYLALFNLTDVNGMIQFRYVKIPTYLTAGTDTATIDSDIYAKTTIPYLAIGEVLYNRGEEKRGAEIINFGMGQVKEMYNFYDNKTYENINGVHYKMAKGKLNI